MNDDNVLIQIDDKYQQILEELKIDETLETNPHDSHVNIQWISLTQAILTEKFEFCDVLDTDSVDCNEILPFNVSEIENEPTDKLSKDHKKPMIVNWSN